MKFLKTLLFTLLSYHAFAGGEENIPVLIRLVKNSQSDSLGYNIVEQLPAIVYREILDGRCKLWDTHDKDIQLTPSTLKEIEQNSNTSFSNESQLFIYENWTRSKNEITTNTLGFLFFNKNAKDEDVAYGYVDYAELSAVLLSEHIKSNADGWFNVSFAYALNAKFFDFDIIQFGNNVYKSRDESQKIRNEYVGLLGFNASMFPPVEHFKGVDYILERSANLTDTLSQKTETLLSQIETLLQKDKTLFNKIGGYRMQNLKPEDMHVSRIIINELWLQRRGGVQSTVQNFQIYFNDAALDAIGYNDLLNIQLPGSFSLVKVLADKKFNYVIIKINDQEIKRSESFLYQKALNEANWNNLIEKVKSY